MMDDWDLLEQFRLDRSEPAFRELVSRHAGFVLATCRRRLRDLHLSEDAAQAVFVVLARRPPTRNALSRGSLAGWLYQTTVYVCNNAMQARRSREFHERQAAGEFAASCSSTVATISAEVEVLLDRALSRLSSCERDAVLLRYYQDQSVQQVGAALGISQNTATKRIGRAIERMREFLASSGLAISSPLLIEAIVYMTRTPIAPPMEFVGKVVAIAIGQSVVTGVVQQLSEGVSHMIRIAKIKLAASVAAVVIGAGGLVAVNQLFAAPGDPKPAPATAPAKAPGATSNTPKGVLKEFAAAVRKGDSSNLAAISVAETDDEKELIRAACAYIDATGAFSNAVADKFGKETKKELDTLFELTPVGRFTMFIEMTVDQVPEQLDGNFASFQPPGVDDLTLWVQNVDGQWKLATGRMCEHWTPENWRERIGLMNMAAQGMHQMAEGIASGKYASFAELKRDLAPIVRQNR